MIVRAHSLLSQMLDNLGVDKTPDMAYPDPVARSLQIEKIALQRALQAVEDRLSELTVQKVADDRQYQLLAERLERIMAERDALQAERDDLIHERDKTL